MISSETLGQDETLSASAQDVVSASQSYSESVSAGASMEANRSVSAAVMIPAIAANQDAAAELDDLIARHGLAGEVQRYEDFHGERDMQSFDGNADLAHTYAQAHVASQHVANGERDSAMVQAGLADVFETAEGGFGRSMGDATGHSGIMDNAPSFGGTASEVGRGMASGPAGLDAYEDRMAETRASVENKMTGLPSANQQHTYQVEREREAFAADHAAGVATNENAQEQARERIDLDLLDAPSKLHDMVESQPVHADPQNPQRDDDWISP